MGMIAYGMTELIIYNKTENGGWMGDSIKTNMQI